MGYSPWGDKELDVTNNNIYIYVHNTLLQQNLHLKNIGNNLYVHTYKVIE